MKKILTDSKAIIYQGTWLYDLLMSFSIYPEDHKWQIYHYSGLFHWKEVFNGQYANSFYRMSLMNQKEIDDIIYHKPTLDSNKVFYMMYEKEILKKHLDNLINIL